MSIGKAISMEDAIRKLVVVSEALEQYEDVESMSLSMLVSDCIDYLREKQLEKKWHTGTPTEEGWYVLLTSETIPYSVAYWQNEWLGKEWTIRDSIVVAWMPITPFEASKEK